MGLLSPSLMILQTDQGTFVEEKYTRPRKINFGASHGSIMFEVV
jgi:hypothetical protein